MKIIEVDEQLYNYIASQTQHIGESASDILRRLLLNDEAIVDLTTVDLTRNTEQAGFAENEAKIQPALNPASIADVESLTAETRQLEEPQESVQIQVVQDPELRSESSTEVKPLEKEPVKPAKKPTKKKSTKKKSASRKSSVRLTESTQLEVPNLKIDALLASNEFTALTLSISRFLMVLSVLYKNKPDAFSVASEIKGKKRCYFSKNQQELEQAGRTTKPREIPDTPYWVITNINAGRKRLMVSQLMQGMGYDEALIEKVCETLSPAKPSETSPA